MQPVCIYHEQSGQLQQLHAAVWHGTNTCANILRIRQVARAVVQMKTFAISK